MPRLLELRNVTVPAPQHEDSFQAFLDQAFQEADELFDSANSKEWRSSSKLYGRVRGSDHTRSGESRTWHARTSIHLEPTYETFYEYLYKDHATNEKEYIKDMQSAQELAIIKPRVAEAWLNSYHLPFPTTNRDFSILILSREKEAAAGQRQFTIVQLPYDSSPQKGYIRGTYMSIERVTEVQHAGKTAIEWRMMVQSDPKGAIPGFLSEPVMTSTICKDVDMLLNWLQRTKNISVSTESIPK